MPQGRDYLNVSAKATETKGQEAATGTSDLGPAIPSISLPKSGGAIRGLGEKFTVNPATGTGSLSVPLVTSPGRSGFGPQLTLSYDSGSGNGVFGFGWTLSLPSITRKTDKGLPRYLDGEESDVFLISGSEDLVPILDGAQERVSLPPRKLHKVDYNIQLYRPRIEGLFSRIERWTRTDNGVSHWRAITRDNVTSVFGFDANSRIVDPGDERRIFSYLICLTFDDKGNAAQYEYAPDDLAGVDKATAHEANRGDPERRTQRYLKYVRYGNVEPYFPDWSETGKEAALPANWHFQIVFDYGDHRETAPTPARDRAIDPDWPVRPDPFSSYRSGFEVRTYRRCERVLLFHQFAGQTDFEQPCLVRSTDFRYSDENAPADPRNPVYTFLESVTQTGYRRKMGGYEQRSTPPLELFYSQPQLHSEILKLMDAESLENLPEGLDGSRFEWVDLDGEGLSGILTKQDGGWSYKRNLSPLNRVTLPGGERVTRARFGAMERIRSLPVPSGAGRGQQLLDLTGEGRLALASFDEAQAGYFQRTADEDWEPFKSFGSLPRLNWSEPNLKFIDLTGDGLADVLVTEDNLYTFYQSLGAKGFSEAEHLFTPWDEEKGARVVFADETQAVSLADISGDGLSDIVRVRNGEVCYWPNLGYGRFGAKVSMDNAPRFADEESFDPSRVRFADVDGSGTTDLLYIGDDGVEVCFNRSGNSWAEPHVLALFPGADKLSTVQAADLLGNGTACLVWSSSLPGESYASLRYVDLMGSQKPHMMVGARNNLGAETRVSYAPSTRFYLEDKRAGKPWITRLPFPVQVVERLEIYDWISRSRFVTRYAYHHGYFDGEEREFRGFGMVEQRDTETHRDDALFADVETTNEDSASFVPPVLTRTWFHTGAFIEAGKISTQYADEYWVEPALRGPAPANVSAREALLLPDTILEGALAPEEIREAYRALKGSTLRIETYAEDGTSRAPHPYTVTEQNFAVRLLQPRGHNKHAVFMSHPRESISYNYERQPEDPRVTHKITLEVDEFGNVCRSVSVGYGRRSGYPEPEPNLSPAFRAMLAHDQRRIHVGATGQSFTTPVRKPTDALLFDAYRAPLPSETITAELTGIAPAGARFTFEELDNHWTMLWDGAHDIPYEEASAADVDGAGATAASGRRIVERSRTLYRSNDLAGLLPLGTAEFQALPGISYRLALTPDMITRIFGADVTDAILIEGGYVRLAGQNDWWRPGRRIFYSPLDSDTPTQELSEASAHFYQPRRFIDAFGATSRITFDTYDLLPTLSADALDNVTTGMNDYRLLTPYRVTDVNGNFSEVAFDCLGRVAGTAVSGKAGEGDTLASFDTELSDTTIQAVRSAPLVNAAAILANATSRIVYDPFAYFRTRHLAEPDAPMVYTLTRETHVSDLKGGEETLLQHEFAYSDGFGREVQRKAQAEAGPVTSAGSNVSPRWVGTGWVVYNNKDSPVRKYEPFFSQTHHFEFDRRVGVSSVMFYDPLGRTVAALHPNNTFEKTVFSAWRQETWDSNDTVLIGDPRADDDVGDFFRRLLGSAPGAFTSWHARRAAGTFGSSAEERQANQDAAQKAAQHAATPSTIHFDSLGRKCLSVLDNGVEGGVTQRYATRTALDAEGKALAVFDAEGHRVVEYCRREPLGGGAGFRYVAGYDIAGSLLYQNSMDNGERRMLSNVAGNELRAWDARGFAFEMRYDRLRRLTHRFAEHHDLGRILLERLVYGEKHSEADRNLKGKLYRHYDGAGVAINERYDFKGNVKESVRQFARLEPPHTSAPFYESTPDWSPIKEIIDSPSLNLVSLDGATAPLLNADDRFTSSTRFDALNRPVQVVTPHTATARPSVIQPSYNEANLLERVDVWIRQSAPPTDLLDSSTADIHAVTGIEYNARGQRINVSLGNRVVTGYEYDPETFRLTNLTSTRPNTFAADARTVQALAYQYDPVGNTTSVHDSADIHNVVYFSNRRVEPSADYTYDPLYRLKVAVGREHLGQTGGTLNPPIQAAHDDSPRTHSAPNVRLLNPSDGNAMGIYTERYNYDPVDNLTEMIHEAAGASWTRRYAYESASRITASETSNRLSSSSLPGDAALGPFSATYDYDEHGNMTRMAHLPRMTWDEMGRLQSTTSQIFLGGMPETTYYLYNSDGERLRKVTYSQAVAGATPTRKSERLYLGVFEIYREYDAAETVTKERETLHVMDDRNRTALVETRTAGTGAEPGQLIRYQFGNHLGSATLELDESADVISYEEYFPYGSTSYQAVRSQTDTPKRYRYTAKERDEENDLYYHGARYYAPWLGRWTACDPGGLVDGLNLYAYVRNNPIRANDPTGKQGNDSEQPVDPARAAAEQRAEEFLRNLPASAQDTLAGSTNSWNALVRHFMPHPAVPPPQPPPPANTQPPTPAQSTPTQNQQQQEAPDPPQPTTPIGQSYQAAPGQNRRAASLGGFGQILSVTGFASQYAANVGLVPQGGSLGAEFVAQGAFTQDPTGAQGGSFAAGLHGWYGPNTSRFTGGLYFTLGNVWGQNPTGVTGGNGAFSFTAVGEILFAGRNREGNFDRDHPWLTLGANVTGGYQHFASVSATGSTIMPTPTTSLINTGTGSLVLNGTLSLLYRGSEKTPRVNLWAEAYGSVMSGHAFTPSGGAPLPSGLVGVVGGSAGVTGNIPFGQGGLNVLSIGGFVGARQEWDRIGGTTFTSTNPYFGAGTGFARRF